MKSKFLKSILLLLGFLYIAGNSFAEDYVCTDASYRRSVGSALSGCSVVSESSIPAQRDIDDKVPQKYRKVISNLLQEMSSSEKTAVDAQQTSDSAAALLSSSRSGAKDSVDQLSPEGVRLRSALLLTLDELNILRQWLTDFKAQVALASNLSDLKIRVATLPNTPQRTATQLKNAIKTSIDNGSSD